MLNIIAAILLFGMIVLVHEFGHFLAAKLNGIGVTEFSIGMGPRLFSFVRGETRYSLKALPFGGSCMMVGEDAENPDPRAFNNKPVLARIMVIAAGPVFNFILAFLFAMIMVHQVGHDYPVLAGVQEGSPAAQAGLQAGDVLTEINGKKIEARREVSLYLLTHPGEPITLEYQRPTSSGAAPQAESGQGSGAAPQAESGQGSGSALAKTEQGSGAGGMEEHTVQITPRYDQQSQSYMLGVLFGPYTKVHGLGELIKNSAYEVKYCIVTTFESFQMLFKRQINASDAMAGPVQIISMVGNEVGAGRTMGAGALLYVISYWTLLLSSSLGIMNLLPIPALDGGRLLFLLIELVRGKPIDPEKEGMIHLAGMIFLMALMVLILFNDVRKLL